MRLWSLHPTYLDARGLVALWRETLLAQAVLRGQTKGYRNHPQLTRFMASSTPLGTVADYLRAVYDEALERGYHFDLARVGQELSDTTLKVTRGQITYEWGHLMGKLQRRDPMRFARLQGIKRPQAHPLFRIVPGGIETWERVDHSA